jgi:hypothetical protein
MIETPLDISDVWRPKPPRPSLIYGLLFFVCNERATPLAAARKLSVPSAHEEPPILDSKDRAPSTGTPKTLWLMA